MKGYSLERLANEAKAVTEVRYIPLHYDMNSAFQYRVALSPWIKTYNNLFYPIIICDVVEKKQLQIMGSATVMTRIKGSRDGSIYQISFSEGSIEVSRINAYIYYGNFYDKHYFIIKALIDPSKRLTVNINNQHKKCDNIANEKEKSNLQHLENEEKATCKMGLQRRIKL